MNYNADVVCYCQHFINKAVNSQDKVVEDEREVHAFKKAHEF